MSYFESDDDLGEEDPPLNATGRAQAEALGHLLAGAPIDLAVCSGMQRTRETAELALGSRSLEIAVVNELREAQPGTFDEIETEEQMKALFVGAFDHAEAPGASFLTGEAYADLCKRVAGAWQGLLHRADWNEALVAAHGVVNRAILAQALGAGPEIFRRLEQDAGCLNVLDIEGAGPEARVGCVRLMNFTPYNAIKSGMQETTLEMLWRQFSEA